MKNPWIEAIRAPWQPVFVDPGAAGYEATLPDWKQLLQTDALPADASGRATIVLVYDPKNPDDLRALRLLEDDDRFRYGSQAFRCLRLDGVPFKAGLSIAVYGPDGALVGVASGGTLRDVLASMETAYRAATRRRLQHDLDELRSLTDNLATCRQEVEGLEMRLVCKDCGCVHAEVSAALERFRVREREYASALEAWGRPAR